MRRSLLILLLISTVGLFAQTTVDFDTDFAEGWEPWIGQTLTFSNDFYLCDSYNKVVAPHRLRAPEEYGDETTLSFDRAVAENDHSRCVLSGVTFRGSYRTGTIIRGLKAKVTAANCLQAVNTPTIIYNTLPTERPDLGATNLVVCAANIENFFVTLGGYAGAENEEQLETQKTKISTALFHMDADIYALCEVEQGPLAATELVRLLNALAQNDQYAWVDAGFSTYDAIMVCYIYRKDKVKPYGSYLKPYTYGVMKYREAIQCFEQLSSGERFNLALNHFYAKRSKDDVDRIENMNRLVAKIPAALNNDPDMLVVGDLNAYTMEESNLILSRDNDYEDLLMKYDSDGYSYVYNGEVGFIDHAYANNSMAPQITKAVSYHLNADTWTTYSYPRGDTSMYRYADHDPILIGLQLGKTSSIGTVSETHASETQKQIRHGQLIIIRSGIEYSVTGQRIR